VAQYTKENMRISEIQCNTYSWSDGKIKKMRDSKLLNNL